MTDSLIVAVTLATLLWFATVMWSVRSLARSEAPAYTPRAAESIRSSGGDR